MPNLQLNQAVPVSAPIVPSPTQAMPINGGMDSNMSQQANIAQGIQFVRKIQQRVVEIQQKLAITTNASEQQSLQRTLQELTRVQATLMQKLPLNNQVQQAQQQAQQHQAQQSPHLGTASPIMMPMNRNGQSTTNVGQGVYSGAHPAATQNANVIPNGANAARLTNFQKQNTGVANTQVPNGVLSVDQFKRVLTDLLQRHGKPVQFAPVVSGKEIDLYRLFNVVRTLGGSKVVSQKGAWPSVAMSFGLVSNDVNQMAGYALQINQLYKAYLELFEEVWNRAMVHQLSMAGRNAQLNKTNLAEPAGLAQTSTNDATALTNMGLSSSTQMATQATQNQSRPVSSVTKEQLAALNLKPEQLAQLLQQPNAHQLLALLPQNATNQASLQSGWQTAQQQDALQRQQQSQQASQILQQQQIQRQQLQQLQQLQQRQQLQLQQQQHAHQSPKLPHDKSAKPMTSTASVDATAAQPKAGTTHVDAGKPRQGVKVTSKMLKDAETLLTKIEQSLTTSRPKLPILSSINEKEKNAVLQQVEKLRPLKSIVAALLPAFLAMTGNVEPVKRVKVMIYMFEDQLALLPQRQCIFSLADLEKLKVQMTRCIGFVRMNDDELAQKIMTETAKSVSKSNESSMAPSQRPFSPTISNKRPAPGSHDGSQSAAMGSPSITTRSRAAKKAQDVSPIKPEKTSAKLKEGVHDTPSPSSLSSSPKQQESSTVSTQSATKCEEKLYNVNLHNEQLAANSPMDFVQHAWNELLLANAQSESKAASATSNLAPDTGATEKDTVHDSVVSMIMSMLDVPSPILLNSGAFDISAATNSTDPAATFGGYVSGHATGTPHMEQQMIPDPNESPTKSHVTTNSKSEQSWWTQAIFI